MKPQQKYALAYARLGERYGQPVWQSHGPPVDVLVGTILSQATSDVNTERGFAALKARYPDWQSAADAPEADVIAAIHSTGLANVKGPRIQAALRRIRIERGEIELDFLAGLPLDEALGWLTQIDGVGPKTAAIVMLFAFGRPAFPVDTHVHRGARRLGLVPSDTSAARAHRLLPELGEPKTFYPIHINLIRHGRETCRARNPLCSQCVLADICDYYADLNAATS